MSVDPAHPCYVSYIDRTRQYYGALGYGRPYRWSYDPGVPPFVRSEEHTSESSHT